MEMKDEGIGVLNWLPESRKQAGSRKTRSAARKHEQMNCAPESHIPREIRRSKHLFFPLTSPLPSLHIP